MNESQNNSNQPTGWIHIPVVANIIGTLVATLIIALVTLWIHERRAANKARTDATIARTREEAVREVFNQQRVLDDRLEQFIKAFSPPPSQAGIQPFANYRTEKDDLLLEAGVFTFDGTITDYPPGAIKPEDAPTARFIVESLQSQLSSHLFGRLQPRQIAIEIQGCADGLPVRPSAIYRGDFGDFTTEYWTDPTKPPATITFTSGRTRLTNEIIALLRCIGIHRALGLSPALSTATHRYGVLTTDSIGGQFRRVLIRIRVADFLPKQPLG